MPVSFAKKVLLVILMFLYIFALQFSFIPGHISTRILLAFYGIYIILRRRKDIFRLSNNLFHISLSLIFISLISTLSIVLNNTKDLEFVIYPVSMVFIFFSAYGTIQIFRNIYGSVSPIIIAKYYIICVFVQSILAVLMFFNTNIKTFLLSLLNLSDTVNFLIDESGEFRLVGFGLQFFDAGIVFSICLIFIVYLVTLYNYLSTKRIIMMLLLYIWIAIIGIMMARTTMVGICISICVLIARRRFLYNAIKCKYGKIINALIVILVLIFSAAHIIQKTIPDTATNLLNFGFEMFVNYSESGDFSSASTNRLKEMYEVIPESAKTIIIGDGYWMDKSGSGSYYKFIDVGYIRLVFYFGLIGLLGYFIFQYELIKAVDIRTNKQFHIVFVALFAFLLLLNLKGFAQLTTYVSLFLFIDKPDFKKII